MKYVVYAPNFESTDRLFEDIKKLDYVDYIRAEDFIQCDSAFIKRICRALLCRDLIKPIFLKNVIYRKCNAGRFDKDDDVVYIYIASFLWPIAAKGFVKYLRKTRPNSYHVVFFLDVFAARKQYDDSYKKVFDRVLMFDKAEAEKMHIGYYPLPYSKLDIQLKHSDIQDADLYFVGQAKSRFKMLLKIFEFCKQKGISTNFYIIGVPETERKYQDEIHYIDFIPYETTLEICARSNCGIELVVEGVESFSQRVPEALIYGKKIITDNPRLLKYKYYDQSRIFLFDKIDDIDVDFVKSKLSANSVGKQVADDLSPISLLQFLDKELVQN